MNAGKTLFAQLMDIQPIRNALQRRQGVRTMSCAEQFRVMAFAQLTYREKVCETSRSVYRCRQPSCTTWGFAKRYGARRWPMPTNRETGVSMPTSPPD